MTRAELLINALSKAERQTRIHYEMVDGRLQYKVESNIEDSTGYMLSETFTWAEAAQARVAREKLMNAAWTLYCVSTRIPNLNVNWEVIAREILDDFDPANVDYQNKVIDFFKRMFEVKEPVNWNYPVAGAI